MTSNSDKYTSYVRGWRAGACFRPIDPAFDQHSDEQIREAYADGWADGRVAAKNAFTMAESAYGYAPSILRSVDTPQPPE